MTLITSTGIRDGQPHTTTATIDDAEIARRKAAAEARRNPVQTTISAAAFFARFTDVEKAAVAAAASATPTLFVGLIHGLANGSVDLTSAELSTWMDGLVSAGAITGPRKTVILTP